MIIFNQSHRKRALCLIVLWSLLGVCMNQDVCFSQTLQEFVVSLETKPYFKEAQLGVYVTSEQGEVLLNHYGEKSMLPNSILKLFTTAAALKILGEDFRFCTQLLTTGLIDQQTLKGDVVILGDGDPSLGGENYRRQLSVWARALKEQHIAVVEGSVIGDASCFEQALSPATWLWEDIGNYYGAGACGLNFHENAYKLVFQLGKKLGAATKVVHIEPSLPHVQLVNEVVSGPQGSGDQASIFGGEFSTTQYVRGSIPLDRPTFAIKGSIPDPAYCCAKHLQQVLQKEGIVVNKEARSSFCPVRYEQVHLAHETYSPKLSEMVYTANQCSHNLYSEAFLKKMGMGKHATGLEKINHYLKGLNISLEGVRIMDGSGLSMKNLVTARSMVELLSRLAKEPYFATFLHSLPCNTQNSDNKLRGLCSSQKLMGKVYAKTGYSSQGESIAGFLTTQSGQKIRFCIISNHFLGPKALLRKEMQQLLELLVVY
jgi:serine-type D-Ala-D-Ala carboxypeptidase/endopeptidase (penicillin-binding protein 4)